MGSRGQTGKTEKQKQGGGGGSAGGGTSRLTDNQRRGNDDFTLRGIGDKINVVGQHKRGRKPKEK